jgi:hypothetical protein
VGASSPERVATPYCSADDGYAAIAHRRYAGNRAAIENLLAVAGDLDVGRSAFELTRELDPTPDA